MNGFRKALCIGSLLFAIGLPGGAMADDDDDDHYKGRRADPALVAARQHFFGNDNVNARTGRVDKSKVIMSWFGVTSFAVAARGRVFLMDSYIYRVSLQRAYVPATVQDLVDLKPEAIFIGHGHSDHADNAAYIAVKTGATIYGAAEHCVAMGTDAQRLMTAGHLASAAVKCTALTTPGSLPAAEVSEVTGLKPDLCIKAFKHLHSGTSPQTLPFNPINPIRESLTRINALYPQPLLTPNPYATVSGPSGGGAVSIMYLFTVKDSGFTFLWHNTGGALPDFAPQVMPLLEDLPKVDVELGSMVSLGESTNGVRDVATYINLVKPKIFVGNHTDNFNIGASMFYQQALERQFGIINMPVADRPELRMMHDPYSYVQPALLTFDHKDDIWRERPSGKRRAHCH